MASFLQTLPCGRPRVCLPRFSSLCPVPGLPRFHLSSSRSPPLKGGGTFSFLSPVPFVFIPYSQFLSSSTHLEHPVLCTLLTMSSTTLPSVPVSPASSPSPSYFSPATSSHDPIVPSPLQATSPWRTPTRTYNSLYPEIDLAWFNIPYYMVQCIQESLLAGEGTAFLGETEIQQQRILEIHGDSYNSLPHIDQWARAIDVAITLDHSLWRPIPHSTPLSTHSPSPLPIPPCADPLEAWLLAEGDTAMDESADIPSPRPSTPYPPTTLSSDDEEGYQIPEPPTVFSDLPLDTMYRLMLILHTTPDTTPVIPYPQQWHTTAVDGECPFALLDVEGPLSEHDTVEDAFVHILTHKGGCEGGLAQALHMLDDDGVSADVARWQTWTHCLVKLQVFRCHLGELLDQRTLELSLIANRLRNANAYPHLLDR